MFFTACSIKNEDFTTKITVQEISVMVNNKDTFTILFTNQDCRSCGELKTALNESKIDESTVIYEYESDINSKTYEKDNETIKSIFPSLKVTPSAYSIQEGNIIDSYIGFYGINDFLGWIYEQK